MTIFKWDAGYATNIPFIDEQNQRIFNLLRELHSLIEKEKSKKEIYDTARELFEYSLYHFGEEEKFLRMHGYPLLKDHKEVHESFLDSLKELQLRIEQQQKSFSSIDSTGKLIESLKKHITGMDHDYLYLNKSIQFG